MTKYHVDVHPPLLHEQQLHITHNIYIYICAIYYQNLTYLPC